MVAVDETPVRTLPSTNGSHGSNGEVDDLERQIVRGSMFTHAAFDKVVGRIAALEGYVKALAELLQSRGVLTPEDTGASRTEEPTEEDDAEIEITGDKQPQRFDWPAITFRQEPEHLTPPAEVNCAERMHICKAVCCRLNFALTPDEIDAGKAKWDLGNPYFIRQRDSGYCSHNDTGTGRCGIYDDRPGICRRYSCANDERIWKDFDNMVLNQEWIDEHLSGGRRIFIGQLRPKMEVEAELAEG
jgi:Fe-S-cluster containining protein